MAAPETSDTPPQQLVQDQLLRVTHELARPQPTSATTAWLLGIESALRWLAGQTTVGPYSDAARTAAGPDLIEEKIEAGLATLRGDDFARGVLRVLEWASGQRPDPPAPFAI